MNSQTFRQMVLTVCLGAIGSFARADTVPAELSGPLPQVALSGQATMRFLGFDIYNASLWVAPGFVVTDLTRSGFALELRYLRSFRGGDIAKRSIAEMRRQEVFESQQAARWEQQMREIFPDVQKGDRIVGVNIPGGGAAFYFNGLLLGEVRDPLFSRLFFGIWLAPQTSEPALRQALLLKAGGAPR